MQRGRAAAVAVLVAAALAAGCANPAQPADDAAPQASTQQEPASDTSEETMNEAQLIALTLTIDGEPVEVAWEDNESVAALAQLAQEAPLEVRLTPYGGFEQYGPLGADLPRNDVETTTAAGDIVLYTGNQIVVFSGSNSWAYTRLGKIVDKTPDELAELLGGGPVTLTIAAE